MMPKTSRASNVPSRTKNSPTKLFRPGRPSDDKPATRNNPASHGIGLASPPNSEISRVWVRSYIRPTHAKSMPVESP